MHAKNSLGSDDPLSFAAGQQRLQADVEIKLSQVTDMFNWGAIFGNTSPVEVELGCGKGMFIINSARQSPATNYLGIEKSAKFFRLLKDRVLKSGTQNIRLVKADAPYLIRKFLPHGSVQAFHIYFPDPWPKKRHRKRRLITPDFLTSVNTVLEPKGRLMIATDFLDYFKAILNLARGCEWLEETGYQEISPRELDPRQAITSYERKYLLQGRTIYRVSFRKI